jgi:hypothetical protein
MDLREESDVPFLATLKKPDRVVVGSLSGRLYPVLIRAAEGWFQHEKPDSTRPAPS